MSQQSVLGQVRKADVKKATHDIVLLGEDGRAIKEFDKEVGKEVSKRIGGLWATTFPDEQGNSYEITSNFSISFDNGERAMAFYRKPKEQGQGQGEQKKSYNKPADMSKTVSAPVAAQANQAAQAPARGKSRFGN